MDCQQVYYNITNALSNYIFDNDLKSMVIGVSGGIDSALVCALATTVARNLKIPLIGYSITIHSNKEDEIERSKMVGVAFCDHFQHVDFSEQFFVLKELLTQDDKNVDENSHSFKVRMGNIKARMRMMKLYDAAQKNGGLVLSTNNYTEYALGFWTLHGDVGDLGPIQKLKKTEVYELSAWISEMYKDVDPLKSLALDACIKANPTDGLGITNSDLDQLGAPTYVEVDNVLNDYFAFVNEAKGIDKAYDLQQHPTVKVHERTHFKRCNPYNFDRESVIDLPDDWKI